MAILAADSKVGRGRGVRWEEEAPLMSEALTARFIGPKSEPLLDEVEEVRSRVADGPRCFLL